MTGKTNKNTRIIHILEKDEEGAGTKNQNQLTSLMLSVSDAIGMVITSQNVEPICPKEMVKNLIL